VDPQRPGTLVVTTMDRWFPRDEVYRSTNGGASWTAILSNGLLDNSSAPWSVARTPHWLGDVEIDPLDSNRALFVTGYGLWASDNLMAADAGDRLNWRFANEGLEETVPLDLISPPSGAPLLSALGDIGGFRHDDFNASPAMSSYFASNRTTNTSLDFAENNPSIIARVHWGNSRGSYSSDGGMTWADFGSTLSAATDNGPGAIAVSADGSTFLWLPKGSAAYYSTDGGMRWKKCKKSPTSPTDFRTMWPTADRVNPSKFYVYDIVSGTVYVSTNAGAKFKARASGLPIGEGTLRAVPGLEGNLWLPGGTAGLYRSGNSGSSFSQVTGVQEGYQVGFGKAAAGQTHPAIYLWGKVRNVTGIFRSDDAATTWVRINDDQHQYGWINAIIGDARTYGRVYLATGGRGIVYGEP
ncbi:MAG TPA: carbohydrate-binding protein, partial [Blastocatellia bacterium]|nr:carbohydrate-binding protein [Blastocatellia bacterium]